jgi:AraC-like DNA-binding protein
MLYLRHTPAAPLAEFVEYMWFMSDSPAHRRERIVPCGTVEFVINLREDEIRVDGPAGGRYSGAVVSGAHRRYFVVDTAQHASIMGVHFRPGGAFPFLGVPTGEVADRHLDLEALWGAAAGRVRERLCAARVPAERFALMEEALGARLRRARERHGAVPLALALLSRPASRPTVRGVAARVGLSHRRLIEVFEAEVGMPPKLFGRLLRWRHTLAAVRSGAAPGWARLAPLCGYFDQSHLIRDFLQFCGLSPEEYVRQRNDRVKDDHLPIAG